MHRFSLLSIISPLVLFSLITCSQEVGVTPGFLLKLMLLPPGHIATFMLSI